MGNRAARRKGALLRARIRQMIEAGYSTARMVKETGASYVHVARLEAQEREALEADKQKPSSQRDRVSPEGRLIGTVTSIAAERGTERLRLAGVTPGQVPTVRDEMCPSCACRRGTIPNGCLQTQLDLVKAVVEAKPFLCHAPKDGRMCAGWVGVRAEHVANPLPEPLVAAARRWEFSPPDEDDKP